MKGAYSGLLLPIAGVIFYFSSDNHQTRRLLTHNKTTSGGLHLHYYRGHDVRGRILLGPGDLQGPDDRPKYVAGLDAEEICLALGLCTFFQPPPPLTGLEEHCGYQSSDPDKRYWCPSVDLKCCDRDTNDCQAVCPGDNPSSSPGTDTGKTASTPESLRGNIDTASDPSSAPGTDAVSNYDTASVGETGTDPASDGDQPEVASIPVCGNGIIEDGEECDEGEENGKTAASPCKADCKSDYYVLNLEVKVVHDDVEFYLARGSGEDIADLDEMEANNELQEYLRIQFEEGNVFGSGHPITVDPNYQTYTLHKYLTPDECYRFIFWDDQAATDGIEMELKIDGIKVYDEGTYKVLKTEKDDSGGVKFGNCGGD